MNRISAESGTRPASAAQAPGQSQVLLQTKKRDLRSKVIDRKEESQGPKLVAKGYDPLRYGDTVTIQTGGAFPLRVVADGVLTCTAGLMPRSAWNSTDFEQEQLFMLLPKGPTSCREKMRACIQDMRAHHRELNELDEVVLSVLNASIEKELATVHSSRERRWRKHVQVGDVVNFMHVSSGLLLSFVETDQEAHREASRGAKANRLHSRKNRQGHRKTKWQNPKGKDRAPSVGQNTSLRDADIFPAHPALESASTNADFSFWPKEMLQREDGQRQDSDELGTVVAGPPVCIRHEKSGAFLSPVEAHDDIRQREWQIFERKISVRMEDGARQGSGTSATRVHRMRLPSHKHSNLGKRQRLRKERGPGASSTSSGVLSARSRMLSFSSRDSVDTPSSFKLNKRAREFMNVDTKSNLYNSDHSISKIKSRGPLRIGPTSGDTETAKAMGLVSDLENSKVWEINIYHRAPVTIAKDSNYVHDGQTVRFSGLLDRGVLCTTPGNGECWRCGEFGHWATACKAATPMEGFPKGPFVRPPTGFEDEQMGKNKEFEGKQDDMSFMLHKNLGPGSYDLADEEAKGALIEGAAHRLEEALEEAKEKDSIILLDRDAEDVRMGPASAWVLELACGARRGVCIREGSEVRLLNRDANMYLASVKASHAIASRDRKLALGAHHYKAVPTRAESVSLGLLPSCAVDDIDLERSLFKISSWEGHQQRSVKVDEGEHIASDDLREEIRMDKPIVLTHIATGAILEPLALAKWESRSLRSTYGKPLRPVVLQPLHGTVSLTE